MEEEDKRQNDSLGAEEDIELDGQSHLSYEQTEPSSHQPTSRQGYESDTVYTSQSSRNPDVATPTADGMEKSDGATTEGADSQSVRHLPDRNRCDSHLQGTMSNSALNVVWSFGFNKNVPVLNLTDGFRNAIMYCCGHIGIMHDYENNIQYTLQGHVNCITCSCISDDKHWLVTGDKGPDATLIVWDTYTGIPIHTIFDSNPEGGFVAVTLTPNGRYMATISAGNYQIVAVWDWTLEADTPICSASLQPAFGLQTYIHFLAVEEHFLVTNSETQVLFFHWDEVSMKYYAPPLTDDDFEKPVGRYSQSVFVHKSTRALTATSLGRLVVWDNNMPIAKVVSQQLLPDKKAIKLVQVGTRAIDVLTTTDRFIVTGDHDGHIRFFDYNLHLIQWFEEMRIGPVTSVSFAVGKDLPPVPEKVFSLDEDSPQPIPFVVNDLVIGSSHAMIGVVKDDCTAARVLLIEHTGPVHALASHPLLPRMSTGGFSGLLQVWDYDTKLPELSSMTEDLLICVLVIASRQFEHDSSINTSMFDCKGVTLVVGFTDGSVSVLDALTLETEGKPFRLTREPITHIAFSHDNHFLAIGDAGYTTSLLTSQDSEDGPYRYVGRYRAHYKPIQTLLFGVQLDSDRPRLLSLGADRRLVEYDLQRTEAEGDMHIACIDRIEQSAVPRCMAWYPPFSQERFLLTSNDQYKLKLYNCSTKMCRKTVRSPTYGSPPKQVLVLPSQKLGDHQYAAYITEDKLGLLILPLDGNPHNAMALVAHPKGVSNLVVSWDGCHVFTSGGTECVVHMWEVNINALEAQASLGGQGLQPYYGLLEGGRGGALFAELEDYFYYSQIRSQHVNCPDTRVVSTTIQLTEVPCIMRALGFYPTEQEIDDMSNEVKFSRYVETGQFVDEIDLGTFIKLYVNQRPTFGLSMDKMRWAFSVLGTPVSHGSAIERGELLDLLQNRGEHLTEQELADHLCTLLGHHLEGDRSDRDLLHPTVAADLIDRNFPASINADIFTQDILGLLPPGQLDKRDQ